MMKYKWLLFLIIPISAFADQLIVSNITNGCSSGLNNNTYLLASFTPNQYRCYSGEYLPADTDHCETCSDIYNCNGGIFAFNETKPQGINSIKTHIDRNITGGCEALFVKPVNNVASITAKFIPNVYTCAPGYYLLADAIACTICPAGNKCFGGTYTFNETTTQGVEPCPNSTPFAPVGSAVCYPHVLHIGNESIYLSATKRTTPSLNVAYGNEVFYANMTTTQTVMTAGSSHYFKTIYNDTEYYICDATSCPQ